MPGQPGVAPESFFSPAAAPAAPALAVGASVLIDGDVAATVVKMQGRRVRVRLRQDGGRAEHAWREKAQVVALAPPPPALAPAPAAAAAGGAAGGGLHATSTAEDLARVLGQVARLKTELLHDEEDVSGRPRAPSSQNLDPRSRIPDLHVALQLELHYRPPREISRKMNRRRRYTAIPKEISKGWLMSTRVLLVDAHLTLGGLRLAVGEQQALYKQEVFLAVSGLAGALGRLALSRAVDALPPTAQDWGVACEVALRLAPALHVTARAPGRSTPAREPCGPRRVFSSYVFTRGGPLF